MIAKAVLSSCCSLQMAWAAACHILCIGLVRITLLLLFIAVLLRCLPLCCCQVIDRILYKLDELVRPYVHKILVVIEPLLIDEDYYARVEGREIIANLSKAAGLATMIAAMRPDIDNIDECALEPCILLPCSCGSAGLPAGLAGMPLQPGAFGRWISAWSKLEMLFAIM